jgi:hypothetical protein
MALTHVSSIINRKFGKNSLYALIKNWRQITGDIIFRISAPIKIKGDTLIVAVKNNVWVQELSFLKSKLLEKLHNYAPDVKDIVFILSSELNRDKEAQSKFEPNLKEKSPRPKLNNTDLEFINSILKKIEDKELRGIFENIIKVKLIKKKLS